MLRGIGAEGRKEGGRRERERERERDKDNLTHLLFVMNVHDILFVLLFCFAIAHLFLTHRHAGRHACTNIHTHAHPHTHTDTHKHTLTHAHTTTHRDALRHFMHFTTHPHR